MTDSEHSAEPDHTSNGCVLVIDDHDQLRQMLALALDTAGFEVLEAGTQLDLHRRLAEAQPDAVVINLQRSATDGLAVLARMRARQSLGGTPILFLAGSHDDDFRRQAIRLGADWFGLRPLGMIELQKALTRVIRDGRPIGRDERPTRALPPRPLKRTG